MGMRPGPFAPQQPHATPRLPSPLPARTPSHAMLGPSPCAFNNALQHPSYGVASVNRPSLARPRFWHGNSGTDRGGGGLSVKISSSFNSSPHLKIFCANGPPSLCAPLATQLAQGRLLCTWPVSHTPLDAATQGRYTCQWAVEKRTWAYCPCVRSCCLHLGGSTSEPSVQPVCLCRLGVLFAATGVYKN